MNSTIMLSYLLIFAGIVVWSLLIPSGKKMPQGIVEGITVFGGAFLLASCFINLVPHMYADGFYVSGTHLKIGAAVLVGFLIQMILEYTTNGVEHGHNHCHGCEEEEEHHEHSHGSHFHPVAGLIIGLSIHAFLEGMPLVESSGEIHQSLLYGIVLHNIPLALVLVSLFAANGFSFTKSALLLALFAIMTPLGSLFKLYCLPGSVGVEAMLMGVVVGILLHVSVSILFDKGDNAFRWWKVALIVAAFITAYFTPGCAEIYG